MMFFVFFSHQKKQLIFKKLKIMKELLIISIERSDHIESLY